MRRACAVYLEEHKRENLLKRVSVSTVMSMRPYIDRIMNELRVLENAAPDDEERKLGYVTELTEKLDDLNIILERWIKMRQGEMNLQVESFSLAGLFAIIEKSRQLLESRGITLKVGDGAQIVKADKALTLFMINTLVDNAAKLTPSGGSVTLECTESSDYVEVAVTDTGVGISQSDIDRILNEKVYDAASIGSDNEKLPAKSKGGGFGLMNCRGIIEKYRKTDAIFSVCSMNIESRKGDGSRFSFRLPKGVVRCILLLIMLFPCKANANVDICAIPSGITSSVIFSPFI
jgi:signal transduction histidine kinase